MIGSIILPVTLYYARVCADCDSYSDGRKNRSASLHTHFIGAVCKSLLGIRGYCRPTGTRGQFVFHRSIYACNLPIVLFACRAICFIYACWLRRLRYVNGLHF